jgi:chromosome segregation ATPase
MMVQTKKVLQKQVEKLKQENEQFRFALKYLTFDLSATRREKDGAMAQVILLREELAELKQMLEDGGLIG